MLELVQDVSVSSLHVSYVETEQNKVLQHLVLFLKNICDKREEDAAICCPAERQLDESTWPTTFPNVVENGRGGCA